VGFWFKRLAGTLAPPKNLPPPVAGGKGFLIGKPVG